jgi:hypothetical protein
MAKILQKVFASTDQVSQSFTVQSWHVSQSVDAFTGASDYDITISGSLDVTGPLDVTGDLSLIGNSLVTGDSVVNRFIIYNTDDNIAIVNANNFNTTTDIGVIDNIRLGDSAGQSTQNTIASIMIGSSAGVNAQSASYSNFLGIGAGGFATFASGSNFIGYGAGNFAALASNSNLFGYNVGRGDISGNSIGPNNIVIGTNISLPYNYRNGINIGGILFGSGSYTTPTGNVFSGSVGNGRIGINQPNPSFNLDVSGSGRFTNGLSLTGSLSTTGSVTLQGLTTTPKSFVVTIDNTTGQLFYTSSTGFVAGAVSPGAPTGSIQYNNAGAFAGVSTLTYDGTTLRATGSFSGSFTGIYNNLVSLNNTTNATFPMLYASGSGNSITLSGSTGVVLTPSLGRITSNVLQVDGTGTTATGSGVGQIWLNGFGSNLIEYNANGIAAPTTGTRSVGTKIVLWPQISDPGNTDYAIGISSLSLWHSVPSSSYAGTPTAFRWYAGTTNITTLTGTGTFSTNGNVIAFASDKRLKTNIKPIKNPLDKVKSLNGFTYNWNDKAKALANYDTEESLVGVFAQEIQEVLPEAVKLAPFDNDMTGNSISGENYLTVQYEKIVPLLIEAIKDQQKQIDELKSKIK